MYSIVCAACGRRLLFRSMERIGLRVRRHVCKPPADDEREGRDA
jgi:hypothetical protein